MATKNPAAIPIANSVSNMIDPPHSTPTAGALLSFSILAALWLARRFLPLRLLELYRRAMTLLASAGPRMALESGVGLRQHRTRPGQLCAQ